eukprot:tig00021348_g20546.t1
MAEPAPPDTPAPAPPLGCSHYQRAVRLVAPCCGRVYSCHWCHDEAESHKIDRKTVTLVECARCNTRQPVAGACSNADCEASQGHGFASYFCEPCRLYSSDPNKPIYHCPDCTICRVGHGLGIDFFHCNRCAACIGIALKNGHKCVSDMSKSECPICFEFMFTSRIQLSIAKCGHAMHQTCYAEFMRAGHYRCPLCKKSVGDMRQRWEVLDEVYRQNPVHPDHARMKQRVTCCDCERQCVAPFHYELHRCAHCGSYNTAVLAAEPDDAELTPVAPRAGPAGGAESDDEEEEEEDGEEGEGEEEEGEEEEGEEGEGGSEEEEGGEAGSSSESEGGSSGAGSGGAPPSEPEAPAGDAPAPSPPATGAGQ